MYPFSDAEVALAGVLSPALAIESLSPTTIGSGLARERLLCCLLLGSVDLIQRVDECHSMDLVLSRNEISGEQDRSAGLCGALAQVFLSSVTRY